MDIDKIEALENGLVNVIIETPRGSMNKYDYEPDLKIFKLKKTLPVGSVFPFDFGFVPNTLGEDGDPLDVLVIMEETAYQGVLITCRLIGILQAKQKERNKAVMRNDRIVAIADASLMYAHVSNMKTLGENVVKQIEAFFINYNKLSGKEFVPIKWGNEKEALKQIKTSIV